MRISLPMDESNRVFCQVQAVSVVSEIKGLVRKDSHDVGGLALVVGQHGQVEGQQVVALGIC
jgi:hypothetical protein